MLERIISGGQTGVDQAGWRNAKAWGLTTGGWMPRGFTTEQGPRPEFAKVYGATEHEDWEYAPRRRRNIVDSDFTLVMGSGRGSRMTATEAQGFGKPYHHTPHPNYRFEQWDLIADRIADLGVKVLNIAGSRGSNMPPVEHSMVDRIFERMFRHWVRTGYHHVPDLVDVFEDEAGDIGDRVGGNVRCPYCLRCYRDHPSDQTRTSFSHEPFLNVLCSGKVVKL